jgi:hypothetical protein
MCLLSDISYITRHARDRSHLSQLLREQTGCASDYLVVKYNGRPRSGQELYRAFKNIHAGMSERRIVLRHRYE